MFWTSTHKSSALRLIVHSHHPRLILRHCVQKWLAASKSWRYLTSQMRSGRRRDSPAARVEAAADRCRVRGVPHPTTENIGRVGRMASQAGSNRGSSRDGQPLQVGHYLRVDAPGGRRMWMPISIGGIDAVQTLDSHPDCYRDISRAHLAAAAVWTAPWQEREDKLEKRWHR